MSVDRAPLHMTFTVTFVVKDQLLIASTSFSSIEW